MYDATSSNFSHKLWKVTHDCSKLYFGEQTYASEVGIFIKKLIKFEKCR